MFDLEEICKLSVELGAYRHLFHSLRISKEEIKALRLNRNEMLDAQRRIFDLRDKYSIQIQPPYLPVDTYFERKEKDFFDNRVFGCGALKFKCGITSNGDMYPCLLFSGNEKLRIGNVLSDNLKTMWNSDFAKNVYDSFNSAIPENCKKCIAVNECDYGCKKVSYEFSGCFSEQDVSCPYSKGFV